MKKICLIAQFPPPIHGLSKAVETLFTSKLNGKVFEFEKIDLTDNKKFLSNLYRISKSDAELYYFTISQTKGGNIRDLIILELLHLQHKKCLVHLHGGYYRKLVDEDMTVVQKRLNYRAIRRVEGTIVLSSSLSRIFEGMISRDKIFTVPNCIDDEFLLRSEELLEKITRVSNESIHHVLWLSNFIKSKGYLAVLKMAKMEKDRVEIGGKRSLHFDFAGKFFGDEEKCFCDFIDKYGLHDYITYHGIVLGEEKKALLKSCLYFILPTNYPNEGQPISILEAMGNGCIIITSNHAGIPDIVEDGINGLIVDKTKVMDNIRNMYEYCLAYNKSENKICYANWSKVESEYREDNYLENMKLVFLQCIQDEGFDNI